MIRGDGAYVPSCKAKALMGRCFASGLATFTQTSYRMRLFKENYVRNR